MQTSRFISEPYRLLFPLAILIGFLGISHWAFYALGFIDSYSKHFHASLQMQAHMNCFVFGFLMTALPRMTSTTHARAVEVISFIVLTFLLLLFQYCGQFKLGILCYMGTLLLLIGFIASRVREKRKSIATGGAGAVPPVEFIWLPVGLMMALIGSTILLLGGPRLGSLNTAAWNIVHQGYILTIVMGVGSFLAPRLMGTFLPARVSLDPAEKAKDQKRRKLQALLYVVMGAVLFGSFFLDTVSARLSYGLRAILVTAIFIKTRALTFKAKNTDPFIRPLKLSFWMVVLGQWVAVIAPAWKLPLMHLTFLGGYSLMTFSIGTMVILSHAGAREKLQKSKGPITWVYGAVLSAMILRVLSPFFPEYYFPLLGVSSGFWVLAAVIWMIDVGPYVFKFPSADLVEQHHEEAKKRVMDC